MAKRRELNLRAVIVIDGEERDLFTMEEKERNKIARQLKINFLKSIGCRILEDEET